MKFCFAGYDIFVEVAKELVNQGWDMVAHCATRQDEKYNSSKQLVEFAAAVGSISIGESIGYSAVSSLKEIGAGVLISAGYGYRIPDSVLSEIICINIHPTMLPLGKGPWPLPRMVVERREVFGVTIHKMGSEFDSGDVLLQRGSLLSDNESLESVTFKAKDIARELALELAHNFDQLLVKAVPQYGSAEYWPMPNWERDRMIDWNMPVSFIYDRVRSYGKFATGAVFEGKEWIVTDCRVWKKVHDFPLGSVVARSVKEALIAASDGFVLLTSYEIDPDWSDRNGSDSS